MRKFWIIAVLILLWNLLGDAAYLMQASADIDEIAARDPVQAQAFREMPGWAWSAYAIRSRLNLWSNFTYFLDDPVEGDQFEQAERRSLAGEPEVGIQ